MTELRRERPADHGPLRDLHRAAFGEQHGPVVAALVDDLRRSLPADAVLALVAEDAGAIVGHVMFTRSLLDAPARLVEVMVLSPLAVRPDRQGAGVGSRLVRAGLDRLTRSGTPVVFVEGDPAYYGRFGFGAGAAQGFRKPSLRIPDPAFQAHTLPAHRSWMSGTLVYAEPFWRQDAVGLRDPGLLEPNDSSIPRFGPISGRSATETWRGERTGQDRRASLDSDQRVSRSAGPA